MSMQKTVKEIWRFLILFGLIVGGVPAVMAQGGSSQTVYLPLIHKSLTENSTRPLPLKMYPTIESVGITAPFGDDLNDNNLATIYYRSTGAASWTPGPIMTRDAAAREWRVSLVYLTPGTDYEVRVIFQDLDGVSQSEAFGSFRTLPDYPDTGAGGSTTVVSPEDDLQAVLDAAQPGDIIQLQAGVYYTALVLNQNHSGRPGAYITLEAAPGATAILDGTDPAINGPGDDWTFYQSSAQENIYYTSLPWGNTSCNGSAPGYVGELVDGQSVRYLLFTSDSASWNNDFLASPPGKAYYVCNNAGPGPVQRLYVVTYAGDDPDDLTMYVSRYLRGIDLKGTDYLRIRGLSVRHYSWSGIRLGYAPSSGADHNVIEANNFYGIGRYHLRIDGKINQNWTTNNLIQNNQFSENGYRDSGWQWDVAYHQGHTGVQGIYFSYSGSGNVIRYNRFTGLHDGIAVKQRSGNIDIHNNIMEECMDDGIEIDNNPGQNIRLWNNRIEYCYVGISLQNWDQQSHGPVYVFRNVIFGGPDPLGRVDYTGGTAGYNTYTAFKVGSRSNAAGSRAYLYHNTIFVSSGDAPISGLKNSGGEHFAGVAARNNLWHIEGRVFDLNTGQAVIDLDFDCDNLHNVNPADSRFIRWSNSGGPTYNGNYTRLSDFQAFTGQERHGISDTSTGFQADMSLKAGSPDIDAGCIIPGFNDRGPDAYAGPAPDIGAFEYRP